MSKDLNNWLDEVESKPKDSTNNAIKKEIAKQGYNIKEQCNGKHKDINDILNCKDCSNALDSM
jgi:hypothetical protein